MNKIFRLRFFYSFLIIAIVFSSNAYCNKQDSLKLLIKGTKDDRLKVELLNNLSKVYLDSNHLEAIRIASTALELAKIIHYNEEIISSHTIIGYSYFYNHNYSRALENYLLASRYLKSTLKYSTLAQTYTDIAAIYNTLKNPKKAIYYNAQSLKLLNKNVDSYLIKNCYFSLASSYRLLKDFNKELDYLRKGIEIIKKNKLLDQLGIGYNKLGYAYWDLKKYDTALNYYEQYLQLSKELGDSIGLAQAYSNIGSTLYSKGEYLESIKYFKHSIKLHQPGMKEHALLELVKSYCKLNDLDQAAYYFNTAQKAGPDLESLIKACDSIAAGFTRNNNKEKVIEYLLLSRDLHKAIYKMSQETYESKAQTKYDIEGLEARIIEKEANQLLKENFKLKVSQNRFLFIILFLVVVIGAFIIYLYRKRLIGREKELKDADREKSLLIKELNYLKDQFNSHITFNFLNFCYGNIYKISTKTGKAIELFSDILRYSLITNIGEKIPLKDEIEHIKNFLNLQKLLTSKLFFSFRHNDMEGTRLIHPRILITFVENAFKHGKTNDENAPIEIVLETDENSIKFRVKNKKQERREMVKKETGIGHRNVDQVLNIFYKDKYNIHTEDLGELYACSLVLYE